MRVITARSVSDALSQGLHAIRVGAKPQASRVGDVLVMPYPVMTIYQKPLNRVLFSPMRDANPFFHVMETLWMLGGRNDLPWLTQFNKRFVAYSDDGGETQPGAYGYRWRNYFGYDQLETIIAELKANPGTRRAVLAMWDGGSDSRVVDALQSDLLQAIAGSADVPCNTHAYFDTIDGRLNMTVMCRSNDVIWGAYGANAVHFSFLLEYVAAMTGLPMGVYRQFSNNYHVYTNVVPYEALMPYSRDADKTDRYLVGDYKREEVYPDLRRVPLVDDAESFLSHLNTWFSEPGEYAGHEGFLRDVAAPMWRAWQAHKAKDYDAALAQAQQIMAEDWRIAAMEWLTRRMINYDTNKQRFTESLDGTA